MKTFKQYLMEEDYKSMIDILKDDCGPWLSQSGNLWGMRGLKNAEKATRLYGEMRPGSEDLIEYSKHPVRMDRKPKDMNKEVHAYLDEYFEEKYGIKARSQTMFCFGFDRRRAAKEYGEPYMIFPIGDFDYIWSIHVEDLWSDLPSAFQGSVRNLEDGWENQLKEYMDAMDYKKNKGLNTAMKQPNEIMISVPTYYAVHETFRQKMEWILHD